MNLLQIINEEIDNLGVIKLYHKLSPKYTNGWEELIKSVLINGLIPHTGEEFGDKGVIWFSDNYNDYGKNGNFVVSINFDQSKNGYSNNEYELNYDGHNGYGLAQIPFNKLEILKIPILYNETKNYVLNNKTMIEYINQNKLFTPDNINKRESNGKLFVDLFNKYVQPYITIDNFINKLDKNRIELINIF